MIQTQLALLRRELWEHRSIYVAPAVLVLVVCLMFTTGQVAISSLEQEIDLALLGATLSMAGLAGCRHRCHAGRSRGRGLLSRR